MSERGWKPQYGISAEGVRLLGYFEALPREERLGVLDAVQELFRSMGYISLHDDVTRLVAPRRTRRRVRRRPPGKVLPFRRAQND